MNRMKAGADHENMLNALRGAASTRVTQPREGWVCAKCGRSYSPTWFECQPCNAAVAMSAKHKVD